jgi:hypothetical protein
MTSRVLIAAIVVLAISVTPQIGFAASVPSAGSLAPDHGAGGVTNQSPQAL